MKKNILCRLTGLVLSLITSTAAFAQDFATVDLIVGAYPKNFSKPEDLAARIARDFTRDDEKARAAYTWIATNISYDVRTFFSRSSQGRVAFYYSTPEERAAKEKVYMAEIARKALTSKIAVCQGYAVLFQMVCDLNGIQCVLVPGTAKSEPLRIGKLPQDSDHAWNAVKIGRDWKLVDVTWAAGALENGEKFKFRFNDGYFFTDPDLFFLNHFPEDKNWLLTPKTEQEFASLPLYFRDYINSEYTFLEPESGILRPSGSNSIPFKIMDLSENDQVSYAFSNEGQSHRAAIRRTGNVSEFEVLMGNRSKGYLTVFVNNRSVAAYKIQ